MYGSNDPLKDLNLKNVEAREGVSILKPGRHAVYVAKAELNTQAKVRRLDVLLVAADGSGQITARLNLWHQSEKAREIAYEQLKSLCVFGGHPNPDQPFLAGTDPMLGLAVGVTIAMGNPYKDDKGVERVSPEVKGFYKLEPNDAASVRGIAARAKAKSGQLSLGEMASAQGASPDMDDEIPF